MWHPCTEALPTKVNFLNKKVSNSTLYSFCDLVVETIGHVLCICPFACDVWFLCSMKLQKPGITNVSFVNIIVDLQARLDRPDFLLFAFVCKSLWLKRNSVIYEDIFIQPNLVYQKALQASGNFKQALAL